jgi:hypothetical protein
VAEKRLVIDCISRADFQRRSSGQEENMKYLKILGLAAVAVMALMAFVVGFSSNRRFLTEVDGFPSVPFRGE